VESAPNESVFGEVESSNDESKNAFLHLRMLVGYFKTDEAGSRHERESKSTLGGTDRPNIVSGSGFQTCKSLVPGLRPTPGRP
jgi:hypothetical protein